MTGSLQSPTQGNPPFLSLKSFLPLSEPPSLFVRGEPDPIPTPPRLSASPFCGEKGDDHREDARTRRGTGTSNTFLASLNPSWLVDTREKEL